MSKENKFTPGPWALNTSHPSKNEFGDEFTNAVVGTGECNDFELAHVLLPSPMDGGWNRGEANARLIAAAPELLEALTRLVNSPVAGSGDYILSDLDIDFARATIAKAKGAK